jgi:predicted helicase
MTAAGSGHSFSILATASIPDLALWGSGSGQFFPRYTYEARGGDTELDIFGDSDPYTRVDNVTDEILSEYRGLYGIAVTKDDVFFFVYGLLHSPDYRLTYAADLKKMLPRIPKLSDASDFVSFAAAGRKLSALHLDYESVAPYPLEMVISTSQPNTSPDLRVTKMHFAGKAGSWDKSTIRYNDEITLTGIPDAAHEYMLGSRSAIEWIIERYRVKPDKDSGIVNDPNDWAAEHDDPEYILDLLKRIVTVSVETVAIVNALPSLRIQEQAAIQAEVVNVG